MSVNPGFGGQSFIPHTLEKIRRVRAMLDRYEAQSGRHIAIEVDGGIKPTILPPLPELVRIPLLPALRFSANQTIRR